MRFRVRNSRKETIMIEQRENINSPTLTPPSPLPNWERGEMGEGKRWNVKK
jgi:hypothetical protein